MSGILETTSPYSETISNLEKLKLHRISQLFPDYVRMVSEGEKDFSEAMAEMTRAEVSLLEAKSLERRLRSSGLPFVKTLKDFDWSFQPTVPRALLEELATLRFLEQSENVLFVGSPGVGKTHLAIALGVEAVKAGMFKKRLKYYARSTLLIIDEMGYLDIDEEGTNLFYQLVAARYEQRSIIMTTNVGIGGWGKVFGDEVAASAIADRICHHSKIIKITGRSYRLKDLPMEKETTKPKKIE